MSGPAAVTSAADRRLADGRPDRAGLRTLAERRFARSRGVAERFFRANDAALARTCLAMAERFQRGGRLLAFGAGAQASDAEHVAVEFVHPIVVGKRALPALAVAMDAAFEPALSVLARQADVAIGLAAGGLDGGVARALAAARSRGLLAIALVGEGGAADDADFIFRVPSSDPFVVQEVHETLYHVLWELVHVFLEHRSAGTPLGAPVDDVR